jgi:hypothetical protein
MADSYLDGRNIDDLGRMVTALLTELWIVRDRLAVVEKLYGERLDIASGTIDDFIPDAAFAAQIETIRDRMVGAVVGAPLAARERSVDQILARAGLSPAPADAG